MLPSPCSKERGFSLVEVIIAIFLTTIAVLAVFSLAPTAWVTSSRSDYLGRASGILYQKLQEEEARIMNPCKSVSEETRGPETVYASGQSTPQPGDAAFQVTTTVKNVATNTWLVTVRITWSGNNRGIQESLIVNRQETFRYPDGCTSS
ncbi:MAG: prepilin-type N-terminal cleavage/methylation domain-containing protein [Syntrophales bacterium]|nr:prepilin-type N-terminal cleavage/methylation domain-containing protein [Syntrophales bacterium]